MTTTDGRPAETLSTIDPAGALPQSETLPDGKGQAQLESAALREMLRPVRGRLQLGRVLAGISAGAALAPYIGIAELGRIFLTDPVDTGRAGMAVAIVLGGMGLRAVTLVVALLITHFADVELGERLRRQMIDTIAKAPLSWFTRRSSGQIRKSLDNDLKDMHYLVAHSDVETTTALLTPLLGLGYALWIDWRLGVLAVATLPFYVAIYAWMSRGQADGIVRLNHGLTQVSAAVAELVTGVTVIKTFGRVGRAHRQYQDAADAYSRFFIGWMRPMLRIAALSGILLAAPVVLLVNLLGGWWFVSLGWVRPDQVVVTTLIALIIPNSIMTVASGMWSRKLAAQAAYRVQEVLDTPALPTSEHPAYPHGHDIEFQEVTFSYEPEKPVLHEISLTVPAGTMTALVGPSGSGKSTLATLVPRFGDPDHGVVRIGGVDVRDLAPEQLYRTVGFVLQEVQLLTMSVRDNIRLAVPDATEEQVERAARAAQIHDVIMALPHGYDSVVGQDTYLSGGERQRVSIARALLADPPILVLDEATSFADPESEAAVQQALGSLLEGRTLLVIAHRLETIVEADQIVVLDRGRLVQQGTHRELSGATDGLYARLWTATHAQRDETEHTS